MAVDFFGLLCRRVALAGLAQVGLDNRRISLDFRGAPGGDDPAEAEDHDALGY